MTTLRQRFREYRNHGDIPPTADHYAGRGLVGRLFGTLLMMAIGFVATAPVSLVALWGYVLLTPRGWLVLLYVGVTGLALLWLSNRAALYLGAPVADHVLGIPREGEP